MNHTTDFVNFQDDEASQHDRNIVDRYRALVLQNDTSTVVPSAPPVSAVTETKSDTKSDKYVQRMYGNISIDDENEDSDNDMDIYKEIHTDDENDYSNAFTERMDELSQHAQQSKANSLDDKISESFEKKDKSFKISDYDIKELSDIFVEMTWIEDLLIHRCGLTTLVNLPPKLKKLSVTYCKLTFLNGKQLPSTITEIDLSNNNIENVYDLNDNITHLNLSNNEISNLSFIDMPKSLVYVNLCNNKLKMTPRFKDGLIELNVSSNNLISLDNLPDSIITLYSCNNYLKIINHLPANLITWKSYKSEMELIHCEFPEYLEVMDVYLNKLKTIPKLPNQIKEIDLNNNQLESIPNVSTSLEMVDLRMNPKLVLTEEQKKLLDWLKNSKSSDRIITIHYDTIKEEDDKDMMSFSLFEDYQTPQQQHSNFIKRMQERSGQSQTTYSGEDYISGNYYGSQYGQSYGNSSTFGNSTYGNTTYGGYGRSTGYVSKYSKGNPNWIVFKKVYVL